MSNTSIRQDPSIGADDDAPNDSGSLSLPGTELPVAGTGVGTMIMNRKTEKTILPVDYEPSKFSVICGRGKGSYQSDGNVNFRALVRSNLQRYKDAPGRLEKSFIVSEVLNMIRESCPVGAFVKREKGRWYDLDDSVCREKVGSLFRDFLHTEYKSSSKAKHAKKVAEKSRAKASRGSKATLKGPPGKKMGERDGHHYKQKDFVKKSKVETQGSTPQSSLQASPESDKIVLRPNMRQLSSPYQACLESSELSEKATMQDRPPSPQQKPQPSHQDRQAQQSSPQFHHNSIIVQNVQNNIVMMTSPGAFVLPAHFRRARYPLRAPATMQQIRQRHSYPPTSRRRRPARPGEGLPEETLSRNFGSVDEDDPFLNYYDIDDLSLAKLEE